MTHVLCWKGNPLDPWEIANTTISWVDEIVEGISTEIYHIKFYYLLLKMGRNRSISRIGSLIRQATADVSGIAKASDTTVNSVVASVRTFSNNAKRTEGSTIANTVRQALYRSSHGTGTSFVEFVDMWDHHVGGSSDAFHAIYTLIDALEV